MTIIRGHCGSGFNIYLILRWQCQWIYVKNIDAIMGERGNPQAAENLYRNLLLVHCKMQHHVKEKFTNVLALLLSIPAPKKYHCRFAIFLDPRYVMELKDIKTFNQSENMDTKILVQQMMPKFLEYIMAEIFSVNPNTPQILVTWSSPRRPLFLHAPSF